MGENNIKICPDCIKLCPDCGDNALNLIKEHHAKGIPVPSKVPLEMILCKKHLENAHTSIKEVQNG